MTIQPAIRQVIRSGIRSGFNPSRGYPTTAAQVAAALGYGDFTTGAGWLCDEASGSLVPAFGAPSLAPVNTPTYRNPGPAGGTDYAVGFSGTTDRFDGGSVFNAGTNDLILLWVGKRTTSGTDRDHFTKFTANPGWYILGGGSNRMQFTMRDGTLTKNATSSGLITSEYMVGGAVLEKGTNKARIGERGLTSGTSTVGALLDITGLVTLDNASGLFVGHGGITGNGADTSLTIAALYIVAGANVATGLSANLALALQNFASSVTP